MPPCLFGLQPDQRPLPGDFIERQEERIERLRPLICSDHALLNREHRRLLKATDRGSAQLDYMRERPDFFSYIFN